MDERNKRPGRFRKPKGWRSYLLLTLAGIFVITLLTGLFVSLSVQVELKLAGDAEIVLEYGTPYQEPGVSATVNGKPLEVVTEGFVDDQKIGTYTLTYRAKFLWFSQEAYRVVTVADTKAPVITLVTNPDGFTLPGESYAEEGYTAWDNYDGDITHKVERKAETDRIIYTVTDSSGNTTQMIRNVTYGDVVPPVITLLGEGEMTIQAGVSYKEPGFTATDNVDGDITDKVEITGKVDTYHPDTYTITYTATDSFGNTTQVTRLVKVKAVPQPDIVSPGGKVIYLTFDDGPSQYTQKLLNVLEKYNVKATFFVVNTGYNMDKLLNAIVDGGHAIGIHSVTHDYKKIYSSEEAFYADLYGMQEIIKDATGVTTTLMRFPGGSSNRVSKEYCKGIMTKLTQSVVAQGFQYFDWNVSSGDAGEVDTTEEVFQNVIDGIKGKNTAIVLQHDIYSYSVNAVEKIIIWGLQNGYTFQALTPNSPNAHHPVRN